eukprot:9607924-Lingulodinium_polyedra.AAC.1
MSRGPARVGGGVHTRRASRRALAARCGGAWELLGNCAGTFLGTAWATGLGGAHWGVAVGTARELLKN